jgi:DNA-binding protein Alba
MPPKFQVYKDAAGKFRFRLRADNNKIIAVGEAYEQHASCMNGVKSVQKNCNSEIEDLTIENLKVLNPKYQIFKDAKDEFRFHLTASNGEIIAYSEGYHTREDCLTGIEVVKNSCNAEIEDLTASPKTTDVETETALTKPNEKIAQTIPNKPVETEIPKIKSPAVPDKSKIVFVGNKMPMDYVMAIITGLSSTNAKEITLKARGKSITTAVDAAEITRNRFLKSLKVSKIAIGTEEMPPREGETRARMVSTIEIMLTIE